MKVLNWTQNGGFNIGNESGVQSEYSMWMFNVRLQSRGSKRELKVDGRCGCSKWGFKVAVHIGVSE